MVTLDPASVPLPSSATTWQVPSATSGAATTVPTSGLPTATRVTVKVPLVLPALHTLILPASGVGSGTMTGRPGRPDVGSVPVAVVPLLQAARPTALPVSSNVASFR